MMQETYLLEQELLKRPFRVKATGDLVRHDNHPVLTEKIIQMLNANKRFGVQILLKGERINCIVIGRGDSHNANFDDSEEGQIFVGVIDNTPINEDLKFNDLVEFQSCHVFELYN